MSGDWTESNLKKARDLGCHIFHKSFDINEMFQWFDECSEKINSKRKLYDFLKDPD